MRSCSIAIVSYFYLWSWLVSDSIVFSFYWSSSASYWDVELPDLAAVRSSIKVLTRWSLYWSRFSRSFIFVRSSGSWIRSLFSWLICKFSFPIVDWRSLLIATLVFSPNLFGFVDLALSKSLVSATSYASLFWISSANFAYSSCIRFFRVVISFCNAESGATVILLKEGSDWSVSSLHLSWRTSHCLLNLFMYWTLACNLLVS